MLAALTCWLCSHVDCSVFGGGDDLCSSPQTAAQKLVRRMTRFFTDLPYSELIGHLSRTFDRLGYRWRSVSCVVSRQMSSVYISSIECVTATRDLDVHHLPPFVCWGMRSVHCVLDPTLPFSHVLVVCGTSESTLTAGCLPFQVTVEVADRRGTPLVFKATVLEMDGLLLVDFRRSKVSGGMRTLYPVCCVGSATVTVCEHCDGTVFTYCHMTAVWYSGDGIHRPDGPE